MKIAVVIERAIDRIRLMRALHEILGASLQEIGQAVGSGQPVAEFRVWGNDHVEVAAKLKRVLDLDSVLATLAFYEVELDQAFGPEAQATSAENVRNLLERSEGYE